MSPTTTFESIAGTEEALATVEEISTVVTARKYSADLSEIQFRPDEVTYPRLRLGQGQTPEVLAGEAKGGEWLLAGEKPCVAPVLIPMAFTRIRQMRDQDRSIVCQSPDSIYGVGEYGAGSSGNPSGQCAKCPMSKWRPDPKNPKKNLPPPCTEIYSYVCYSVTHGSVCVLEMSRSAMQTAKFLNQMLQAKGFMNFGFTLAAQAIKGPKGQFYVPSLNVSQVSEEDKEVARELFAPLAPSEDDLPQETEEV